MQGGPKVRSEDVELDHIFVLCSVDAPEARVLTQLGFTEGSDNTHPGQGGLPSLLLSNVVS
jgi:hypothetical protein